MDDKDDDRLIRADLIETVRDILSLLQIATRPQDLSLPGYRLHSLKGSRKGFWAAPDLAQVKKHAGSIKVRRFGSSNAKVAA